jgi:quercetin dioxygenase-like cupin family protein
MRPVVHRPGQGEQHRIGGSTVVIKATGADTSETLFVGEATIEPGFAGPPPHVHRRLHDMFYVLAGTLTLRLGDDVVEAPAGTFVCVPPGVVHTFSNPGHESVRFLNLCTPSGWESYMRDLGRELSAPRPPSPEEIGRIAARHDFHAVGQDGLTRP